MLGVGINIHFRRGVEIQVESLHGNHLIRIDRDGDTSVTLFPSLDDLLRLHEAIGRYIYQHGGPPIPPIPAEAATDDAESLPPGWRANDCGYEHVLGDWVDATHMDAYARAHVAGGKLLGRFATPANAMQALDANRRDLDDDTAEFDTINILSSPVPDGIASSYGQSGPRESFEPAEQRRAAMFAPPEVP